MGRESLVSQAEQDKCLQLMYSELNRQVEFSKSEWQQLQSLLTVKSVPAKFALQECGGVLLSPLFYCPRPGSALLHFP